MTHTYAILEISREACAEIRGLLAAVGYQHAFHDDVIDMRGIALKPASDETFPRNIANEAIKPPRKQDVVAWLIETSEFPSYWNGHIFTRNLDAAVRFCRKEDAEKVINSVITFSTRPRCRAVEHMWVEPTNVQTAGVEEL